MAAVLYLAVAVFLGWQMTERLTRFRITNAQAENPIWVRVAAAFGAGTLVMTWAVYFLAWWFHAAFGHKKPLVFANIIVIIAAALAGYIMYASRRAKALRAAKAAKKAKAAQAAASGAEEADAQESAAAAKAAETAVMAETPADGDASFDLEAEAAKAARKLRGEELEDVLKDADDPEEREAIMRQLVEDATAKERAKKARCIDEPDMEKTAPKRPLIGDRKLFIKECILYAIVLIFIVFSTIHVLNCVNGTMYAGWTVNSDYSPHVSMIRSFSKSANYPTQYPHFGGQDVRYHFMFQFLTGNLEFLGFSLVGAYNIIFIISLMAFVIMLTQLAKRFTGSFLAAAIVPALFFFRSGLAFFLMLKEHIAAGDLGKFLSSNSAFIGYTPNENWGLWCFNVYLNQRHLAFGLLIVAMVIWFFADYMLSAAKSPRKGFSWIAGRFATARAWTFANPDLALLAGALLGACSFWNGAAVIGGLMVLAGFAAFSDHKLDYALTAAVAVIFSWIQTKIFITGSVVSTKLQWGFIAEDKSLLGVLWFFIEITGIAAIGCLVMLFTEKREICVLIVSCALLVFFTFNVSLTSDVTVNQKYIMIAKAFVTIAWGGVLARMIKKKGAAMKAVAVVLAAVFMVTGIYEYTIIMKQSGIGKGHSIDLNSNTTKWFIEETTEKDLILTNWYTMNEITASGCMMYCGWPYYAWSAGYDTYYRGALMKEMYTTTDPERLRELVAQEGITYIVFEKGMTLDGITCIEDTIKYCYQHVHSSDDGLFNVYKTT